MLHTVRRGYTPLPSSAETMPQGGRSGRPARITVAPIREPVAASPALALREAGRGRGPATHLAGLCSWLLRKIWAFLPGKPGFTAVQARCPVAAPTEPALCALARERLLRPASPHARDLPGVIYLDAGRMEDVLAATPDAQQRSCLLRTFVDCDTVFFHIPPAGQEALFSALSGEEDRSALQTLLNHLRLDPLTRYVVLHPLRGRLAPPLPADPGPALSPLLEEGEHVRAAPVRTVLPLSARTEVRRVAALQDGRRVSLHYKAPEKLLPSFAAAHGSTVPQLPVAVGFGEPLVSSTLMATLDDDFGARRRTVSADTPLTGPAPPVRELRRQSSYDGSQDLEQRKTQADQAARAQVRMALVAPPLDLGRRGTLYRTADADYLFPTPQVGFVPKGSTTLPRIAVPCGWYKPLGEPAQPMEMVETNPWSANF